MQGNGGDHNVKLNKPDLERHITHSISCVQSRFKYKNGTWKQSMDSKGEREKKNKEG